MSCNCKRNIRATSYTVGNSFNINTDFNINDLDNGMRFNLILPVDLPAMTTILPVFLIIKVNGVDTNIPMQDIIGNDLMSDQLRFFPQRNVCCGREGIVRIIYGSNPSHFKVLNCLPKSSAVEFEEENENNVATPTSVESKARTIKNG